MLVNERQKTARKNGQRQRRTREKEGKKDGVRPEGSGERSSWFLFPSVVFPVILSPVIWILNSQTNTAFLQPL